MESPIKRQQIGQKAWVIYEGLQTVCKQHRESLTDVIGHLCLLELNEVEDVGARKVISDIVEMLVVNQGVPATFKNVFPPGSEDEQLKSLRSPDWILLLFKLMSRLPDEGWQTLINLTNLGRTGVSFFLSFSLLLSLCFLCSPVNLPIMLLDMFLLLPPSWMKINHNVYMCHISTICICSIHLDTQRPLTMTCNYFEHRKI